jgi:ribosome-binding factor A
VFYTVLGDSDAQAATATALQKVAGLVRSEVGRQTGIKFTPTVSFLLDAVPETARHIEDLLAEARAADEAVAAAARDAVHAGDPDPYRSDEAGEQDSAQGVAAADDGEAPPSS